MMVLQGFIHHTTALGRDHSAAVNWKLELLLFFLLLFCWSAFRPSRLLSSMTRGPEPVRSVTLKLSPKLSISSSQTLNNIYREPPFSDACSSRSTPKPRPPSPTMRPNITFQTYACPPAYAAWYCLNGATCFTVKIGISILYNCE